MATKVAQRRLQKEYLNMQKSPPPFIWASPEEKNILDWHFIVRGPPDSPYHGGEYHGLIMFPSDYPFKPPDVKMFTPSGRFEVGHKICMSMTSYHPSTWNAAWSVATILTGLLSFMLSDEITAGAVRTTEVEKKALATQSHAFNLNSKKFREVFPKYATPGMTDLPDMGTGPISSSSSSVTPAAPLATPRKASRAPSPSTPESESRSSAHRQEGQTPIPLPANAPTLPLQQVAAPHRGHGWVPSWKWIVAAVVVAVLGRLSKSVGV